jgi:hypothetical protein
MSKRLYLIETLVLIAVILAAWWGIASAEVKSESLTRVEADDELHQQGLSKEAIDELTALEKAEGRQRPVVIDRAEVLRLSAAGFPVDVIRLFIGLDWLTGREERIPITPAQARELTSSGVSFETIRIMLASELAQASSRETGTPTTGNTHQEADGDRGVIVYSWPFDGRPLRLGRQVITKPDGSQVVIYSSPFGQSDSILGREEVTRPDGSQVIVYYSRSSGSGQDILDERAEKDYLEALEILEKIQLHMGLPR